ncbi:MAG TPA: O-antigen ligase family protein [bacterium]|nr:O-antigen ligase family protein [bacterium]
MSEIQFRQFQYAALFIFLAGGILAVFKPAYDYTLIKNVIGFAFCLLMAIGFLYTGKEFSFSWPALTGFIILALWFLCSALLAPCGFAAAAALEQYLLYFLIFLIALNLAVEKIWIYFWLGPAFIATVIALVQDALPSHYGISTFGNPNFFAGHLLMPLLLAVSLCRQKKISAGERIFLGIFVIAGSVALILSKSRAAIAGFAFGLAGFAFLLFPKKGKESWKAYSGLVLFLLGTGLLWPKVMAWFLTNIRYYIWRGTWRMIKMKPIGGWGLGNFQIYYPWYRFREYFRQPEATPVTNNPHNRYLELWCETGLVGLLLFLGFIILILWLSQRKQKESQQTLSISRAAENVKGRASKPGKKAAGKEKEVSLQEIAFPGLAAGVVAVLADNLFSTNLSNASTAMFFWFSLGLLAGRGPEKTTATLTLSKALWVVMAVASYVMAVFVSYYRIASQIYLKRGIWAKEAGKYQAAIDYYTTACRICPTDYVIWYKLAYVYGETGQLEQARNVYLYINTFLFPRFAKTDMNLGTLAMKQGRLAEALFYYRWAEWVNPYDKDVLCSIASIYLLHYHDVASATAYLKKVLTLDPENEYANRVLKSLNETRTSALSSKSGRSKGER